MTSHSTSYLHRISVANVKEVYLKSLGTYLTRTNDGTDVLAHASTINIIRTVYEEVKLNIPLESHSELVVLQKMNGANMGVHHYERTSATRIVETISSKMHSKLLSHIKKENYPLSILLDTSTDAGKSIIFLFTFGL